MISNARELLQFYRDHLANDLMRFWDKAFDEEYGGYYTCYSNDGGTRISENKYIWSQGRMLWIDSRYAQMLQNGLLPGDAQKRLFRAQKTYEFLIKNAILPEDEGVCAYLCKRDGTKTESIPGKGYYTSFYVDCFVIMGMAEYGRVTGSAEPIEQALKLYDRTRANLARGCIVSEPYPIPHNFLSHSVPMIMANVSFVLYGALKCAAHARYEEIVADAQRYVHAILSTHFDEERRLIQEMLPLDPADRDTMLARHINPGHAIESMWFCVSILEDTGWQEPDALEKISDTVKNSIAIGWDEVYGGLFRVTGYQGGKPGGRMLNIPYDTLLTDTWDSKLWWPHSEALYVTLLLNHFTGDEEFRSLYDMLGEYIFRVFPNPDQAVGEWIQILGRTGAPLNKVVALPVKDPYHIMRDVMLIIELLHRDLD